MKHLTLILVILCAALPVMAEMPGAIFANAEMGGRSLGMGRSYASIAEGGETFIYNVAGSAFFEQKEIFLNYQQIEEFDQDNEALSFFMPVPPLYGTVGLTLLYFGGGDVQATDEFGQALPSFTVYQMVLGLTYAIKLDNHWGAGVSLKYINDHLSPDYTGSSVAVDVGALYKNATEFSSDVTLEYGAGATIQNIGPRISYQDREQSDSLPRYLRSGLHGTLGYKPWNTALTMSAGYDMDMVDLFTENSSLHWGCEIAFMDVVFLRGGYYTNNYYDDSAFNWGMGFSYANISLDFAMDNLYTLDKGTSIYSLSFRF
ncbi:MAG TPA: PorV/PorQ family protein [Candidatus Mcinerneyibacteriales bacterium]|nr:PorV/PorQ family protein [Candidatus Mcinerneyibacteriales bacterium]